MALLTGLEAARYLGITADLLEGARKMRQVGYIKLSPSRVRYDTRDLDIWKATWQRFEPIEPSDRDEWDGDPP